jgi:hypothetical protein
MYESIPRKQGKTNAKIFNKNLIKLYLILPKDTVYFKVHTVENNRKKCAIINIIIKLEHFVKYIYQIGLCLKNLLDLLTKHVVRTVQFVSISRTDDEIAEPCSIKFYQNTFKKQLMQNQPDGCPLVVTNVYGSY